MERRHVRVLPGRQAQRLRAAALDALGDFRALAGWERFAWLLATVGAGVGGYVVALWMLGMRPADLREH